MSSASEVQEHDLGRRGLGIAQPRGLLPHKDGVSMYLSTEGSDQLFRWDLASNTLTELRHDLGAPTMIAYGEIPGEVMLA